VLPVMLVGVVAARRAWRLTVATGCYSGSPRAWASRRWRTWSAASSRTTSPPDLLDVIFGEGHGPTAGYPQYGISPLSGWSGLHAAAQFPGHQVTTGILAAAIGFAVAAWRCSCRSR